MNRSGFFSTLRQRDFKLFGTSLSQPQVNGLETILTEAEKRKTPLKWLAYMLATVYHESAHTMQPIAEYGKGKGRAYGKPGKYKQAQYGRGLVQLTWDFNYEKADAKLGLNGALLKNFDLALQMPIAVKIMFEGMEHGWFTGKALPDFMSYEPMRKIINGMDKAKTIAGYAVAFENALREAGYGLVVQPKPVIPPDTSTPVVYQKKPEVILNSDGVSHTVDKPVAPTVRKSLIAEIIALIVALFKRK